MTEKNKLYESEFDSYTLEIIRLAIASKEHAYANYSQFKVGACIRFSDGSIYCGANIENASFSLTICAERVALFTGITKGSRSIDALAIAGTGDVVPYPCGACLQVLSEFGDDFPVYLITEQGTIHTFQFLNLFPYRFRYEIKDQEK